METSERPADEQPDDESRTPPHGDPVLEGAADADEAATGDADDDADEG